MAFKIDEMFKSIQGEGRLEGVPSVLVRLSGCNLNCCWCDTRYHFQNGSGFEITYDDFLERLRSYNCKNVIITGGEPLINPQISAITGLLKNLGFHITIETNATVARTVDCDLISMSPKLSHSIPYSSNNGRLIERHDKMRINPEAIKFFIKNYDYQIKFVVRDKAEDFEEVKKILNQIGDYDLFKVLIMPLASSRNQLYKVQKNLARLCINNGFRYANRLQLQIWGRSCEE
jgi:7-carboxy-7-deazaguanine synthase